MLGRATRLGGRMTSDSPRTQAALDRRALLRTCFCALALRRGSASGSPAPEVRYRKLHSPVILPLKAVTESWRPVPFTARCPVPDGAEAPAPYLLLKGILLRLPRAGSSTGATHLKAFCLNCPHELCYVNFVEDTNLVRLEPAEKKDHPLLVCPCHFSVFDPLADAARISGPAHRGLYRFRLQLRRAQVEIQEVEEEALG